MSEEEQKHLMQSYYDLHEKYNKQKQEIERLKIILEFILERKLSEYDINKLYEEAIKLKELKENK